MGFAALIALRIARPIRLGIQQRVQRLLHAAPDNTVQVVLNPHSPDDALICTTITPIPDKGMSALSWIERGRHGAPSG
jgi:hypothetical protein